SPSGGIRVRGLGAENATTPDDPRPVRGRGKPSLPPGDARSDPAIPADGSPGGGAPGDGGDGHGGSGAPPVRHRPAVAAHPHRPAGGGGNRERPSLSARHRRPADRTLPSSPLPPAAGGRADPGPALPESVRGAGARSRHLQGGQRSPRAQRGGSFPEDGGG